MPPTEPETMSEELRSAGYRAIEELGITDEESELQNLALYIYSLEQDNSALRRQVYLLSPGAEKQ